ncbi:hypothetical protein EDC01DRAFT_727818 [Geopyxis carbonaria]|nr:hypothetical protein EDC01DRAFT_727818 [Geopyxis carbonaria]
MPPQPPPLQSFFSTYPSFKYDPRFTLSEEFTRLAYEQGWEPCKKAWRRHHRLFLAALEAESHSAVHTFFIKRHPNFVTYNITGEAPKLEFQRLATHNHWAADSKKFQSEHALLMEAYFDDFSGAMNDYFMGFEDEEQAGEGGERIGWVHNPWNSPPKEWARLVDAKGWVKNSQIFRSNKLAYLSAVEEDFNDTFGWSGTDVEGWKFLCETLGIAVPAVTMRNPNLPPEKKREAISTACKKAMAHEFVNLFDVLDSVRACGYIQFFATEKELSDYSYEWGKVFPLNITQRGSAQFILRNISKYVGMQDEELEKTREKRAKVEAEQEKSTVAAEEAGLI